MSEHESLLNKIREYLQANRRISHLKLQMAEEGNAIDSARVVLTDSLPVGKHAFILGNGKIALIEVTDSQPLGKHCVVTEILTRA